MKIKDSLELVELCATVAGGLLQTTDTAAVAAETSHIASPSSYSPLSNMNKLHGHGGLGKPPSVNQLVGQQPQQHPSGPTSIAHMGNGDMKRCHSSQTIVSASHCSPAPPYNPDPSLVSFLTSLGCQNLIEYFTSQGLQSVYHLQTLSWRYQSSRALPSGESAGHETRSSHPAAHLIIITMTTMASSFFAPAATWPPLQWQPLGCWWGTATSARYGGCALSCPPHHHYPNRPGVVGRQE
ncbi:hypothetical protein INR49_021947 [Caranx melampygus]|nr:hypothetical protein INR49_021947 [Caranx melampygus]